MTSSNLVRLAESVPHDRNPREPNVWHRRRGPNPHPRWVPRYSQSRARAGSATPANALPARASAVYLTAMADRIDRDTFSPITDLVENPVVANPDPVRLDPVQFLASAGARYPRQTGQSFDNPVVKERRQMPQFAFG